MYIVIARVYNGEESIKLQNTEIKNDRIKSYSFSISTLKDVSKQDRRLICIMIQKPNYSAGDKS